MNNLPLSSAGNMAAGLCLASMSMLAVAGKMAWESRKDKLQRMADEAKVIKKKRSEEEDNNRKAAFLAHTLIKDPANGMIN